jgi:Golgi phosphoprotein 3 (GPP34)
MRNLPLASEFFLLAHDEYDGTAAANPSALGQGLAGALLCELIIAGRITAYGSKLNVRDPRPYGDPATDAMITEMALQRGDHPARDWVEHLGDEATRQVAQRLVEFGLVRHEHTRKLLGRSVDRYPANDPLEAGRPRAELSIALDRTEDLDLQGVTLFGLLSACGIESVLAVDWTGWDVEGVVASYVERLPVELRAVISGVKAAVTSVYVTVRR